MKLRASFCSDPGIIFLHTVYRPPGRVDHQVTAAVKTRTLHGGVDQKRETIPALQNCLVSAVDGIDRRYWVRRKEPEGRVPQAGNAQPETAPAWRARLSSRLSRHNNARSSGIAVPGR
jgi:hypothetical protein